MKRKRVAPPREHTGENDHFRFKEQPVTGLTPAQRQRMVMRWPHITNDQTNRFAVIFQSWRELKSELGQRHSGFDLEHILAVEPSLRRRRRDRLDPLVFAVAETR